MTDKHIKKITGFKVDKATEDELMDFSRYELVDIILAYREEYNELTRVHTKLNEKLQAKEQECERLNEELQDIEELYIANATLLNVRLELITELEEQLDQLKEQLEAYIMEAEEGKEINAELKAQLLDQEAETLKAGGIIHKLEQTLTEIKPILEFYANSKMGEEQPDKTYKIMLSGGYVMAYDPKPAREALQKISEVVG